MRVPCSVTLLAVRGVSGVKRWRRSILLVGHVLAPGDGATLVVDVLHGEVRHESSWRGEGAILPRMVWRAAPLLVGEGSQDLRRDLLRPRMREAVNEDKSEKCGRMKRAGTSRL